jgi:hypothetical protein
MRKLHLTLALLAGLSGMGAAVEEDQHRTADVVKLQDDLGLAFLRLPTAFDGSVTCDKKPITTSLFDTGPVRADAPYFDAPRELDMRQHCKDVPPKAP